LLTGETVQGGAWRKETYDFFNLPLFVRGNSIVALGANDVRPDYDFADGAELSLYNLEDGHTANALVRNLKGEPELKVTASREGGLIRVDIEGSGKPLMFTVKGNESIASVDGASVSLDGNTVSIPAGLAKTSFSIRIQQP
jgi:alpha-D-xyloside xylohydrolase